MTSMNISLPEPLKLFKDPNEYGFRTNRAGRIRDDRASFRGVHSPRKCR